MLRVSEPRGKSLWERTVELTIALGERILAPIERFIGRRSLVGDATFFELERFPWVAHIEDNWEVIREELEHVLEDREALPNFQDISKDQIEITDDDRWKTYFLYGYGFEAKLGVETCPRTAALMREIPGMKTAMFSILSPRKHILDHRGPYKGVLRYHLGLIVPKDAEACRIRVGDDIRHWQEGKSMIFDDTFNHEVWNDTDETRVVLFVDVLRPLPAPDSAINRLIVKAIGYSPFVLDAKRNQEAWERRYRQRQAGALARSAARHSCAHAREASLDARDVQPRALQQRVGLRVEHRELARHDQHAEHDHHDPADGDDRGEVAFDDGQRAGHALERQRDQQERDRQAGGVDGEQQGAVRGRVGDRGLREDRAERDARARRPGDREGGAGDERAASTGFAQQRLGMPLAVEHVHERARQEDHAERDDHGAADALEQLFVVVERRADHRRAEPEQDEDRARSSR